jgi:hypothetical protein
MSSLIFCYMPEDAHSQTLRFKQRFKFPEQELMNVHGGLIELFLGWFGAMPRMEEESWLFYRFKMDWVGLKNASCSYSFAQTEEGAGWWIRLPLLTKEECESGWLHIEYVVNIPHGVKWIELSQSCLGIKMIRFDQLKTSSCIPTFFPLSLECFPSSYWSHFVCSLTEDDTQMDRSRYCYNISSPSVLMASSFFYGCFETDGLKLVGQPPVALYAPEGNETLLQQEKLRLINGGGLHLPPIFFKELLSRKVVIPLILSDHQTSSRPWKYVINQLFCDHFLRKKVTSFFQFYLLWQDQKERILFLRQSLATLIKHQTLLKSYSLWDLEITLPSLPLAYFEGKSFFEECQNLFWCFLLSEHSFDQLMTAWWGLYQQMEKEHLDFQQLGKEGELLWIEFFAKKVGCSDDRWVQLTISSCWDEWIKKGESLLSAMEIR